DDDDAQPVSVTAIDKIIASDVVNPPIEHQLDRIPRHIRTFLPFMKHTPPYLLCTTGEFLMALFLSCLRMSWLARQTSCRTRMKDFSSSRAFAHLNSSGFS